VSGPDRASSRRRKLSSIRPRGAPRPGSANRCQLCRCQPRGAPTRAGGCHAFSADDLVADPLVQGAGDHRVQQQARIALAQTLHTSSAIPPRRRSTHGPRRPGRPTPPPGRRATKARTCAEARSSHGSSSTRQISAAPRPRRTAGSERPGRPKGDPAPPGLTPTPSSAHRALRNREALEASSIGATTDATRRTQAPSQLTPAARAIRQPDACSTMYSTAPSCPRRFATTTKWSALSRRTASMRPVEQVAFAAPAR